MSAAHSVVLEEKWLAVAGYEGLYEVSDAGRVRSLQGWRHLALAGAHLMGATRRHWHFTQVVRREVLNARGAVHRDQPGTRPFTAQAVAA